MSEKTSMIEIAKGYQEKLVEWRRHLHQNPELSFEEKETAAWIRQYLKELDIPTLDHVRGNSTVGILKGEQPGPVLLFRADIDALPINEVNDLPYASKVPGVMHACGHDAHTAVLMGFADYLSRHRELIKGTVKFVFQQGEDRIPGGGRYIVEDGVLEDVDYVVAWHCAPEAEVGTVIATGGPKTASFDNFEIRIKGVGGHAGFPFRAIDPISTGALVVTAVNQLIPWTVDPFETATLIVSRFEAGKQSAHNVIPEEAVIEGNFRSHNNEMAGQIYERIKETAENICRAKGCSCEVVKLEGYPALYNHEKVTAYLKECLNREGIQAVSGKPIMGAEDFAFYTKVCPGTYFNVGIRNPERPETNYPPHNPGFCIDEDVMMYALGTFLTAYRELTDGALDLLKD